MAFLWIPYLMITAFLGITVALVLVTASIIIISTKRPHNTRVRKSLLFGLICIAVISVGVNVNYIYHSQPRNYLTERVRHEQQQKDAKAITIPLYSSGELGASKPRYSFDKSDSKTVYLSTHYMDQRINTVSMFQYNPSQPVPANSNAIQKACLPNQQETCVKLKDTAVGELFEVVSNSKDYKKYFIRGAESYITIQAIASLDVDSFIQSFRLQDSQYFVSETSKN